MEKPKFVSFPCIIDGISSRKDHSIKVTLSTPEMSANDGAILLALANQQGYCYLSPVALQESDLNVPDVLPTEPNDRSPSQRLRNALFVLWTQRGAKGDFDTTYRQTMETFIDSVKEKLT